jgi:hypothetical protein
MDEFMSEKAKKMKAQIEQVCTANKDRVRNELLDKVV